ncbi:MAG: hypothetical protein AB7G93_10960 [Bdellovibrionales bacterium]
MRIAPLLLCLGIVALSANSVGAVTSCEILKNGLEVEFDDEFPIPVKAGESLQMHFQARIHPSLKDWFPKTSFHFLPFQLIASNGVVGSRTITGVHLIKPEDVTQSEEIRSFAIDLNVTPAMSGAYAPRLAVFYSADVSCGITFADSGARTLVVENTTEAADIAPPLLTSVTLSQVHLRMGDPLVIDIEVEDKNEICVRGHKSKCEPIDHVAFEDVSTGQMVHVFPPLTQISRNVFRAVIPLQSHDQNENRLFYPGRFRLKIFDVGDVWGNLAVNVPEPFQVEIEINP